MGRPRRDYLQAAHYAVVSWAQWTDRHVRNAGYPHCSVEGRLMEGGSGGLPPGPRVPNVMMPDYVAEVDQAMRVMPAPLCWVLEAYYLDGEPVPRRRLDEALVWISGRIVFARK